MLRWDGLLELAWHRGHVVEALSVAQNSWGGTLDRRAASVDSSPLFKVTRVLSFCTELQTSEGIKTITSEALALKEDLQATESQTTKLLCSLQQVTQLF